MSYFLIATIIGITIVTGYSLNKYLNNSKKSGLSYSLISHKEYKILKPSYSVVLHKEYQITNPVRIYKYTVPTATLECMEPLYKMDLFGNYIKKLNIDETLKDYLHKNIIYQKRVILEIDGFIGDFAIETNINPDTIVFTINDNL